MIVNFLIGFCCVSLIAFTIYFFRWQKTRCRYSVSGTDDHDWGFWEADFKLMIQYRECDCCHLTEVKRLNGKTK